MYLDLARELRNLLNMRVMVIPLVIGARGMVPKGLERLLNEWETRDEQRLSKKKALLRSTRILRSVLETREDLLLLILQLNVTDERWREELTRKEMITVTKIDWTKFSEFSRIYIERLYTVV